jgi:hypothetical protein
MVTLYIKNCYFVLNQCELLCLLASDFPSENPRTQHATFHIRNRYAQ